MDIFYPKSLFESKIKQCSFFSVTLTIVLLPTLLPTSPFSHVHRCCRQMGYGFAKRTHSTKWKPQTKYALSKVRHSNGIGKRDFANGTRRYYNSHCACVLVTKPVDHIPSYLTLSVCGAVKIRLLSTLKLRWHTNGTPPSLLSVGWCPKNSTECKHMYFSDLLWIWR